MIKILLLSDYSREPERRLLRGLVNYMNSRGGCALYNWSSFPLFSSGHSSEIAKAAKKLKVDAIFGIWRDPDMNIVRSLGIPVFLRTVDTDFEGIPMLSGLYENIGIMAANFFLKQHYTNLAFVGRKGLIWSDGRLKGFSQKITKAGLDVRSFLVSDIMKQRAELSKWLEELPKPVGIFACNDMMAKTINELCLFNGLQIPSQVALLGADNDEFLCNISSPAISSINLDFEAQGYALGKSIYKMVTAGKMWKERIPIKPTVIVERESTFKVNIKDNYVLAALSFMQENYTKDINVADIVESIPLSRRAIELHFKREMGNQTMSDFLNRLRVEHMCNLLTDKDMSISQAAQQSGFMDATNVGRIFKKIKGLSPSEYRKLLR